MSRLLSLLLLCLPFSAFAQTILILGDSLSAGYQMSIEQSWPSLLPTQLEERLPESSEPITVINGSISGDTTGNGLSRLPALLSQHSPNHVLIELGANDGLRGFSPKVITTNLQKIIELSQQSGATVSIMQIQVPPNYGKKYTQLFAEIYPTLSTKYQIPLLPFFLEQVIVKPEWMMQDGLHPKPEAQPWIAQFVAENLHPYLTK